MRFGLLVIGLALSFALTGQKTFRLVFSSPGSDEGVAVFRSATRGYYVVGNTNGYGHGGKDVWVLALDSNAQLLWQKTYGTTGNDIATAALLTNDDELLIGGMVQSTGYGLNGFLWRLSSTGVPIYQKTFGGPQWDEVAAMCFLNDSTIIMAGRSLNGPRPGLYDPFVRAWTKDGDSLWTSWPSTAAEEELYSLTTAAGRIYAAGATLNVQALPDSALIHCLDTTGKMLWTAGVSDNDHQIYLSLAAQSPSLIAAAGYYQNDTMSYRDECLMTLDSSGNIHWYHRLPTGAKAYIRHLEVQGSGHMLLSAMSEFFNQGKPGLHLTRFTPNGWWEQGITGNTTNIDYPVMGHFCPDDSTYLVLATSRSHALPFSAITLIQTDYAMDFDTTTHYMLVSSIPSVGVKAPELRVYPNPFRSELTIEASVTPLEGSIRLYSAQGELLLERETGSTQDHYRLDLSTIKSGVYFLYYQSHNYRFLQKVIKL